MALRIICPAYKSMDACSPFSLFGGAMRPYPCLRKQRRVLDPEDLIENIFDEMFLQPSFEPACAKRGTEECCRQQRESSSNKEDGDSDTFTKQMMALRSFKPEEIQIRVTKDKKVIVEARQEMKKTGGEGGFQSYQWREFKQTVDVPENVDIEQLTSSINQEGLLTISAPFLALPEPEKDQKEEVITEEMKLDEEPSDSSNEANENKSESSKEDGSNMNESI